MSVWLYITWVSHSNRENDLVWYWNQDWTNTRFDLTNQANSFKFTQWWSNSDVWSSFSYNTRYNVVVVYDWSKCIFYLNWEQKWTWNYTFATSWNEVIIWYTSRDTWHSNYYVSRYFIEDKQRTLEEIQDDFNRIKKKYGY